MSQSAPKARKPQTKAAQTGSPDAPVRKPAAKAAQGSPAKAPVRKPAAKAAQNGSADAKTRQFNEQLRRALDVASSPTMLIDRDLKITYANEAATALLKKHREHFQKLTRDFDPDNLIGVCIDVFHKDPSKQRRILADPSNLPHRADIHLGPLTFALCASATYDANGVYNGNVFEWHDVTELRELTTNAKGVIDAIDRAQAVVEFKLDGTIITANENFLHSLGYTLNEIGGQHHSMFVEPPSGIRPNTACSGTSSAAASSMPANTSASPGRPRGLASGERQCHLRWKRQAVQGLIRYATDITSQKLAELEGVEEANRSRRRARSTRSTGRRRSSNSSSHGTIIRPTERRVSSAPGAMSLTVRLTGERPRACSPDFEILARHSPA